MLDHCKITHNDNQSVLTFVRIEPAASKPQAGNILKITGNTLPADIQRLQSLVKHKKAAKRRNQRYNYHKREQIHLIRILLANTEQKENKENKTDGIMNLIPVSLILQSVEIIANDII